MPTKTWIATSAANWNTAANWSPAIVPTASDDVIFNSSANGNCTIATTAAVCNSLVVNGYTGSISSSVSISISGGDGSADNYALKLESGSGFSQSANSVIFLGNSTSATYKIVNAGKTLNNAVFGSNAIAWATYSSIDPMNITNGLYLRNGRVTFAGGTNSQSGPVSSFTGTADVTARFAIVGEFANGTFGGTPTKSITATSVVLYGVANTGAVTAAWAPTIGTTYPNTGGSTYLTININRLFLTGNSGYTSIASENTFNNVYLLTGASCTQTGTSNITGTTFTNLYVNSACTAISFRQCTVTNNFDFTNGTTAGSTGAFNMTTTEVITVKGNLILSSGLALTDVAALTFDGTGSQSITFNGNTGTYSDTITVNKASGTLTVTDAAKFGVITLTAGTLTTASNLNATSVNLNGGTFSQTAGTFTYTGTLTNAGATSTFGSSVSGAVLAVSSGTVTFNGSTILSSTVTQSGGTTNFNSSVSVTGAVSVTNGTLNFNNTASLASNISVSAGTMTMGASSAVTQTASTTLSTTLSGTGTINILNDCSISRFLFTGGTLLNITSGKTITISGSTTAALEQWGMTTSPTTITGLTTCTIKFTSATTNLVIFNGGNLSYGTVWWNRVGATSTGINRVLGSNSYVLFKDGNTYPSTTYTIPAHTIQFADLSTQTFTAFDVSGLVGKRIILTSVSGGNYNFVNASSPLTQIVCYFLDVRYSQATPFIGGIYKWKARLSVDGTGTTSTSGWDISDSRYWVLGTGTWDSSTTGHWAIDSGGSPTAVAAPTSTSDVIFDANSGTGTVTIATGAVCASLDCTAAPATLTIGGSGTLNVYDDVALGARISAYTGTITFNFANKNVNFNPGNVTLECGVNVASGANGTITLTNHLLIPRGQFRMVNGSFNTSTNNYNITAKYFVSTGAIDHLLYLNGSTFTTTGRLSDAAASYGWDASGTAFYLDGGTSTLLITGTELLAPADTRNVYIRLQNNSNIYSCLYYNITINRGSHTGSTSFTDGYVYVNNEFKDLGTASHTINFPNAGTLPSGIQVYAPYFTMSAPVGAVFTLDCFTSGGTWILGGSPSYPPFTCLDRVNIANSISYRTDSNVNYTNSTLTNTTDWGYCNLPAKAFTLLGVG